MNDQNGSAQEQYEWVRESRDVLFEYCKTISPEDFVRTSSSFGRGGSFRNLLVHIANTYEFWIARHGLKKNIRFTEYDSIENIDQIIALFQSVDDMMYEFIEFMKKSEIKQITYKIKGTETNVKPFKLFTHVITHEFHHKGQILSLSRHLGYIPVDTDVIR